MTEAEFITTLLELTTNKKDEKPSHNFSITFCDKVNSSQEVDEFADYLNDYLEKENLGVCDIWGLNENLISGDLFIQLNDISKANEIINHFESIKTEFPLLKNCLLSTWIWNVEENVYKKKSIEWGEYDDEKYEELPNLPAPQKEIKKELSNESEPISKKIWVLLLILLLVGLLFFSNK